MTSLLKAFVRLPLRWIHTLGAILGWCVYLLSRRYAARLRENLAASGVCNGAASCRRLRWRNIAEMGKSTLETFVIWLRPQKQMLQLVRACHGWEHVEQAWQKGRGVIFLAPHLGCFEIVGPYIAVHYPITVLFRPPRQAWLEPLMRSGREQGQLTLAPADMRGVRALLKALKRGEAIGVLPDQAPSQGDGAWADFFGRPAYTMILTGRLQQATGAAILMVYAERLAHGRGFVLHFEPMLQPLPESPVEAARSVNAAVEDLVRQCPAQYLWSYNRYKTPRGVTPPTTDTRPAE